MAEVVTVEAPPPPPVERKEVQQAVVEEALKEEDLTIFDGGPHRAGYEDNDLPF